MGTSCVKDKTATPKHANERDGAAAAALGGRRGSRGVGPAAPKQPATGLKQAGRAEPRAGNEKVPENQFGHCGAIGGHNHNDRNGKPGGGIGAYRPSEEVAKAYFEYISDLRHTAIATGIMPSVEGGGGCTLDSTKNNGGTNFAESCRASDYPLVACPPLATLTVYQCQPLTGDSVVAKGMFSTVHLARLSVFTGPADTVATAATPRYPVGRRTSDGSSIVFSPDPASTEGSESISLSFGSGPATTGSGLCPTATAVSHYIIAMKEILLYPSYSTGLLLEQIRAEVRNWSRMSAYSSRVLRCYVLEYVFADGASAAVPEACCHYYTNLVNGKATEEGKGAKAGGGGGGGASPSSSPIGKLLERRKSPSGSTSPKLFGSIGRGGGHGTSSMEGSHADASGTPQKLRLYLEYAKYGTLRGYQTKHMPERFNKRRLHELTARAYMRDVLLALVQVHECGELQYDLSAKSIFLNQQLHMVYGTHFPAYISDVPTGDLASATPTQLGRALGLLDPPVPPPQPAGVAPAVVTVPNANAKSGGGGGPLGKKAKANGSPGVGGNEPINSVAGSPVGPLPLSGGDESGGCGAVNGQGDMSLVTHNASVVPILSISDVRGNNNNSNNINNACEVQQGGRRTSPDDDVNNASPSPSLTTTTSPLRGERPQRAVLERGSSGLRSFGKQASVNSLRTAGAVEGEEGGDQHRLNEVYCRYMDDFDFKQTDGEAVPFPSPHDGIDAQEDADLFAATMLPDEPRATPAMRVVPLQRSALGGVAIVSPDHHVVKPGDALHAPDLRGRLPMVLTRSTNTAAFVCGNPHTNTPTFTPTGAPADGAATTAVTTPTTRVPPQSYTMSSGTAMSDAAGPLGRARGGVPLTKLNHVALIRRALAYGDADKLEDIPVCKYVTVTHAAPEVLRHRTFSPRSDIYAFAMTFIELVTDDGAIMADCLPQNLAKPKTRREKEEYDALLSTNVDKWYKTRHAALRQNYEAVRKEQELPAAVTMPRRNPIVVRIPEHLSDECRAMLRWCLQENPAERPLAAALLRSHYFMMGDWIAAPTAVAAKQGLTKPPEKPWDASVSYEAAAKAIGLPSLSN